MRPEHIVFEGPRRESSVHFGTAETIVAPTGRRLLQRRNGRLNDEDVMRALEECDGHRARAAARLGVSERTLYRYVERMRSDMTGGGV